MKTSTAAGPGAATFLRLIGTLDQGFVLEDGTGTRLSATPEDTGFRIEGRGTTRVMLTEVREQGGWGFLVSSSDADGSVELGRTTHAGGRDEGISPAWVLLEDGRLFRVVARGVRTGTVELLGDETPGAYVSARPDEGGWMLSLTPAGSELEVGEILWILVAAEILALDRS